MSYKALILSLILALISSLSSAQDYLSDDAIKSAFSGKTAIGNHLKKGVTVKSYHAEDGTYRSVYGDGSSNTGEWWVESNKLCVKFTGEDDSKCRKIMSDGASGYKKIHPKKDKPVVHFEKLEDGDQT